MEFRELQLSDRKIVEQFLGFDECRLAAYHFTNIFIWRGQFRIFYIILDGNLCLFLKDKQSCFMYLPPLPRRMSRSVISEKTGTAVINTCFTIMDRLNLNKNISRIENVEEKDLPFYQKFGYAYSAKSGDYLCERKDIVSLKGNRFKSKRACYNYFVKHYDFEFRPYFKQDRSICLALYQKWARQRRGRFSGSLYQSMLKDSFFSHKAAMENFLQLGIVGYVVKIKKPDEIAGYSFGFPLNSQVFCILFETCNLAYKGISQFIFSQFCRQLSDYQYINIMDDSGLANLRRVKLSYHPLRIVPNYIIGRSVN